MSSKTKKLDSLHQLGLFNHPSLHILPRLKASMREALRTSGLSRDQVAERMTELCRIHGIRPPGNAKAISKAMLEKWVAEGAAHVISLPLLPVFCEVVRSDLPLRVLASALGLMVVGAEEQLLLRWARAEVEKRRAAKEARKAAEELGL